MLRLLFSTALAVSSACMALACTTDADCTGGCCYESTCHKYQNISEPCHLPTHEIHAMLYPCGCATDLTCDEIHFDPSLPAAVHDAEMLLLGHGYGLCTDTPGMVFG